jgi:hypothetical protein
VRRRVRILNDRQLQANAQFMSGSEDGGQAIEQSRALQVVQAWGLLGNALQELRPN